MPAIAPDSRRGSRMGTTCRIDRSAMPSFSRLDRASPMMRASIRTSICVSRGAAIQRFRVRTAHRIRSDRREPDGLPRNLRTGWRTGSRPAIYLSLLSDECAVNELSYTALFAPGGLAMQNASQCASFATHSKGVKYTTCCTPFFAGFRCDYHPGCRVAL